MIRVVGGPPQAMIRRHHGLRSGRSKGLKPPSTPGSSGDQLPPPHVGFARTMNGVPLLVVAKKLGHADTRMVEKQYGHLAPSFIADSIRAGAPRDRVKDEKRAVPLR
jgi:hypothetical protein